LGYTADEMSKGFAEANGGDPFAIVTTQKLLDLPFSTPVLFGPGTGSGPPTSDAGELRSACDGGTGWEMRRR
jgi:hypothetical protein